MPNTAAELLRAARLDRGLTQQALAGRSGVGEVMIARIESGWMTPRSDTLEKLLRACGYELKAVRVAEAAIEPPAAEPQLQR